MWFGGMVYEFIFVGSSTGFTQSSTFFTSSGCELYFGFLNNRRAGDLRLVECKEGESTRSPLRLTGIQNRSASIP